MGKFELPRPHYEMSVEAWLAQQGRRKLSQWAQPIKLRPPPPEVDLRKEPRAATNSAFWERQVAEAVQAKLRERGKAR